MRPEPAPPAAQRGMALVLSLVFLAIVTLVSLSSMQGATLQGRMAANQQDYSVALQTAEAALIEAEQALQNGSASLDGWSNHSSTVNDATFSARYRIEEVATVGSRASSEGLEVREVLYRIESEGFGQAANTRVVLESLFVREQRVGI